MLTVATPSTRKKPPTRERLTRRRPLRRSPSPPARKQSSTSRAAVAQRSETLESRALQLAAMKIEHIPDARFLQPSIANAIESELQRSPRPLPAEGPCPRAGLPAYLASLYEIALLTKEEESRLFRRMNFCKFRAGQLQRRIRPDAIEPELLDEIEQLLADARSVREALIRSNLRLVVALARRVKGRSPGFDELVSEGNMALIRAVEKFDYARGFRFSTYATWAVRRAFYHLMDVERRRMTHALTGQTEMCELADWHDPRGETSSILSLGALQELGQILETLNDRERLVIDLRFGLRDGQRWTLRKVGTELGVSKERVRQIEIKILGRLRELAVLDYPELCELC